MRFAICTPRSSTRCYWTGKFWSERKSLAKVYKTMRVREACAKLEKEMRESLVCVNLSNGLLFY